MSADKLWRRACTAVLCGAFATILGGTASAQSLSYMPIDRDSAVLRQPLTSTEEPGGVPGGDELPAPLQRQVVYYTGNEAAGTIIIDTAHTFLYLTLGDGKAMRYGIGVGREGFTWSGVEAISRKSEWPDWIPPAEMIARQPYLPRWVGGGPGNPLGARALYLGNTAYRIHGTNDPHSIGKHVSSGCIRLRDADVIDLYGRVGIGTKVIVLPNDQRTVTINDRHYASSEGGLRVVMTARISTKPAVAIAGQSRPRAGNSAPAPLGLY
ncbi:MAG: L,D-transpeptidase [Xanthobacteraceae bacterium]|jgi:lipoprotein-anchoring transpeptidase ErfK/SrfK